MLQRQSARYLKIVVVFLDFGILWAAVVAIISVIFCGKRTRKKMFAKKKEKSCTKMKNERNYINKIWTI